MTTIGMTTIEIHLRGHISPCASVVIIETICIRMSNSVIDYNTIIYDIAKTIFILL